MSKAKKIILGYIEIIVVFIILCAMLVLGSLLSGAIGLWGTVITELLMVGVLFVTARMLREPVKERFPIEGPPLRSLISALWLAVGGYFLLSAVSQFMAAFFPSVTNTTDVALYENLLSKNSTAAVVIAVVATPAICEELIFRGFFLNKLGSMHKGPVIPIIVSSLLFAVLHFDLYKLPITFIMGAVFGYIAWKTRSVILPVLFHMANNALAVVGLFSADSSDGETLVAIIENENYIFMGVIMLALSAGFIFSGLRRFGTIHPKRWMRILCPILCVLVIFASTNAFVGAITKERLNKSYTVEYPITAENSESFTIEKNSYCTIYVRAFQFYGVHAEFTVADSKGESVYEASGENCEDSASLVLEPGEYTLSYKLAPGEKNDQPSFEAVIITQVIETFEVAESQE